MTAPGRWVGEEQVGAFLFRAMSSADAERIARWQYPEPYSFYDSSTDPDDLAEPLNPTTRAEEYVAVDDETGTLIGFFQYKQPHGPSIEVGLGLHPDWTGRGLGASFVEAGLEYARRRLAPRQFTLSVASFNRRAITVYERVGFVACRVFTHRTNGADWEFVEMRRPA